MPNRLLASGLLLAATALPAQTAARAGDAPPPPDLRQLAQRWIGRQAAGIYMLGSKVGYGIRTVELGQLDGTPALVTVDEMRMRVTMFGETSESSSVDRSWYELQGNGRLLRHDSVQVEDGTTTRRVLRPEADSWVVVTTTGEREQRREVDAPKADLLQDWRVEQWAAGGPEPGARMSCWSLDLDKRDINDRQVLTFVARERLLHSGVPVDAYTVELEIDGLAATGRFVNQHALIDVRVGEVMRVVAEDERLARRLDDAPDDLSAGLGVAIATDLGRDPDAIGELVLEVEGLEQLAFVDTHRQRLTRRADAPDLLHLRRGHRAAEPQPLDLAARARWTAAEPGIECDDPALVAHARRLVGDERDPVEIAERLQHWIYRNLDKTAARNSDSAATILAQRAGDCSEHARLFVALARACGLPAREVGGLLYVNFGQPMFGWHAWAELHDGHQWVTVDPAWDQVFVDATHIRLSTGPDDLAWARTVGALELRVVRHAKH